MIKRNGYFLAAILFCLSVTAACSKNLMPPEGLDGTTSVGRPMSSQFKDSDSDSGSAGSGFNIESKGMEVALDFLPKKMSVSQPGP